MSKNVRVPKRSSDNATLLLAAAEESDDFEVDVVQVSSYGGYIVPEEIAKASGLDYEDVEAAMGHVHTQKELDEAAGSPLEGPTGDIVEEPAPAKKTTAKKAPAKKTAAKKTTAKKAGN